MKRPAGRAQTFPLDNSRYNDYIRSMSSRSKAARPSASLEARIFVALLQTADTLGQEAEQFLKSAGLTARNTTSFAFFAVPSLRFALPGHRDRMISTIRT